MFQERMGDPEWVGKDGTPRAERFPHAAVMRENERGGLVVALGFHPETPLKPENITLPISFEENHNRSQKFLRSLFERLGLERVPALEVDALAAQLFSLH